MKGNYRTIQFKMITSSILYSAKSYLAVLYSARSYSAKSYSMAVLYSAKSCSAVLYSAKILFGCSVEFGAMVIGCFIIIIIIIIIDNSPKGLFRTSLQNYTCIIFLYDTLKLFALSANFKTSGRSFHIFTSQYRKLR